MVNISDAAGRELEYCIVSYIGSQFNVEFVGSTTTDQARDQIKFNSLPSNQQAYFMRAASTLITYLNQKYKVDWSKVKIERLPDSAARNGDVTDIRIITVNKNINLSIKHNHYAVKHQRPGSLPQHLGFNKGSQEDISYRKEYKEISETFVAVALKDYPSCTEYKQLKSLDKEYIDNHLYYPVIKLVSDFIVKNSNPKVASCFFKFLLGQTDFIKVIVNSNSIEVLDFIGLPASSNLSINIRDKSYIDIDFMNGYGVSMRLHTASSKILSKSLKFDSQPKETQISGLTLPL